MSQAAQNQASAWRIRRRNRTKQFAAALPTHLASVGMTAVGLDAVSTAAAATFVQSEIDGLPWVATTSGIIGAGVLAGNGVINDGSVTWQQWAGFISAPPNVPQ